MVYFSPINSEASVLNIKKHSLCKCIAIKKKNRGQSWQGIYLPKIYETCMSSFRHSGASDLFK